MMRRFWRAASVVPTLAVVLAATASSGSSTGVNLSIVANAPPVAVDDSLTTKENTPGTVFPLSNDTDADGDTLTITSAAPSAAHGTVSCDASSCTYTPATDYLGPDSFD